MKKMGRVCLITEAMLIMSMLSVLPVNAAGGCLGTMGLTVAQASREVDRVTFPAVSDSYVGVADLTRNPFAALRAENVAGLSVVWGDYPAMPIDDADFEPLLNLLHGMTIGDSAGKVTFNPASVLVLKLEQKDGTVTTVQLGGSGRLAVNGMRYETPDKTVIYQLEEYFRRYRTVIEDANNVDNQNTVIEQIAMMAPMFAFELPDVDLNQLYVGEKLYRYEYLPTGLVMLTYSYPIFYEDEICLIATAAYGGGKYQYEYGDSKIGESGMEKVAWIYERDGCYFYDGETFTKMWSYSAQDQRGTLFDENGILTMSEEDIASIQLCDLEVRMPAGKIVN